MAQQVYQSNLGSVSGTGTSASLTLTCAAKTLIIIAIEYTCATSSSNPTMASFSGLTPVFQGKSAGTGLAANTYLAIFTVTATSSLSSATATVTFPASATYLVMPVGNTAAAGSSYTPTINTGAGFVTLSTCVAYIQTGTTITTYPLVFNATGTCTNNYDQACCILAGNATPEYPIGPNSASGTLGLQSGLSIGDYLAGATATVGFQNAPFTLSSSTFGSTTTWTATPTAYAAWMCTINNSSNAYVSNLTVTNLNDSGTGSLRAAMTTANTMSGAVIDATGVSGTITCLSALPTITESTVILGAGASTLTINGNAYNAININGTNIMVAFINLTITNTSSSPIQNITVTMAAQVTFQSCIVYVSGLGLGTCNVYCLYGNLIFYDSFFNCVGQHNVFMYYYSGVYYPKNLTAVNSSFIGGDMNPEGSGATGYTWSFTNCTYSSTSTNIQGVTLLLTNVTWLNALYVIYGTATIVNSVIEGTVTTGTSGVVNMTYSACAGGYSGTGNINSTTTPVLVNSVAANGGIGETCSLQPISPLCGAGTATNAPVLDERGYPRATPTPSIGAWDSAFVEAASYTSYWLQALPIQGSSTTLLLTWGGAWCGWDIYMGTTSGGETLLATNVTTTNNGVGALQYTVTGLTSGQIYYFKVAPTGTTTYSNESSATPGATQIYTTDVDNVPNIALDVYADLLNTQPYFGMNEPTTCLQNTPPQEIASPSLLARQSGAYLLGPGQ